MNKKIGCLITLVVAVVMYAGWVNYPPARYSQESMEILNRCQARDADELAKAKDAEKNGYLNPTLLPFWGRKDVEGVEGNKPRAVLDALDPYSDLRRGEDVHLEQSLAKKDPALEKAFNDFAPLYAEFRKSIHQPIFLVPYEQQQDYTTMVPNYIAYRALAQTSTAYAEYLMLQGHSDQALEVAGDILTFGWQIDRQQGALITRMMSIAIQTLGEQTASMILSPPHRLPEPAALESFRQVLEKTHCSLSDLYDALDVEYYVASNTLRKVKDTGELDDEDVPKYLSKAPGVMSREIRLFQNDYIPYLKNVREGKLETRDWMNQPSAWDWLLGRHSIVAAITMPNYVRSVELQKLQSERQGFLHMYVCCLIEGTKSGAWPHDLAELQKKGYTPLPDFDPKKVVWKVEGPKLKLVLEHPDSTLLTSPSDDNGLTEWNLLTVPTWILQGDLSAKS